MRKIFTATVILATSFVVVIPSAVQQAHADSGACGVRVYGNSNLVDPDGIQFGYLVNNKCSSAISIQIENPADGHKSFCLSVKANADYLFALPESAPNWEIVNCSGGDATVSKPTAGGNTCGKRDVQDADDDGEDGYAVHNTCSSLKYFDLTITAPGGRTIDTLCGLAAAQGYAFFGSPLVSDNDWTVNTVSSKKACENIDN